MASRDSGSYGNSYREGGFGCAVADVGYTYGIDGEVCTGTNSVPFIFDSSAKHYVGPDSPGSQLLIRVKPDDPGFSVVRQHDLYRLEHGFRIETK